MIFLSNLAALLRMRSPLIILALSCLLGSLELKAQQPSITDFLAQCELKYGSDADLVNGEKYFYPYSQALGNPFFYPEARPAKISIQGKSFEDQLLRYDIFNQKLILDYTNLYGVSASLVLRTEWVEGFSFEGKKFKKLDGPDGKTDFFQLLGQGQIDCVYLWSKKYLLNLNSGEQSYYFTDPVRISYLRMDGLFHPYKGNKAFIKAFNPELRKGLKQFIKQSDINVKTASDAQMRHLLEYCNALSNDI